MKNESTHPLRSFAVNVWHLYADGFRSMTVGRWLWLMIAVKLIIFFAVIKLFFFPDVLGEKYDNDVDRANAVRMKLTQGAK